MSDLSILTVPSLIPSDLSNITIAEALEKAFPRTKPNVINLASLSDVHFGHPHNPAGDIAANIKDAFPIDSPLTAMLDILFIAGDFFDRLLSLNDPETIDIDVLIVYLLRLCKQHNIILYVLEGTSSHDRGQSTRFETLNRVAKIHAPLKYVKDLSIEYLPGFDINILFVPDDLPGGPSKTLETVRDMMRSKGLEQVDYACMHGQFAFQLPSHVDAPKHDEVAYLELVKEQIFIGHDHTHKQLDRIHVHGSFDRTGHGYESPKGHIRASKSNDGHWDITFVENVNAMKFITVDATGLDLEATIAKVREVVQTLPDGSYVRVRSEANSPIFTHMDTLIRERPLIGWSKDPQRKKEDELAPMVAEDTLFVPVAITRENIVELMLEQMAKNGASGAIMDKGQEILGELFPWRTQNENMKALATA
jgi:hypothetical protein